MLVLLHRKGHFMNYIENTIKKAINEISGDELKCIMDSNYRLSYQNLLNILGLENISFNEIYGLSFDDKIKLLKSKRIESSKSAIQITPDVAEKDFLKLMEAFRFIGNRNIYGNRCTVFTPPSGFKFNEEVANTYYYMYENALKSSEALSLLKTFIETSAEYAIKKGPKSMFAWIVEVGIAIAIQEYENQNADPNDVLDPTLTYLANQSNQSAFTVAYIFG